LLHGYSFETGGATGGIFLKSSRFNHACHPYARCTYKYDEENDCLNTTTMYNISKGEEITISYSADSTSLYSNYGFRCDCPMCPDPKKAERDERMRRGPE
jgi:hypothetical protein